MKSIPDQLLAKGYCIWPNFLGRKRMDALRADFSRIERAAGFGPAGTGQGAGHGVRELTRRDCVHWLDRDKGNPTQASLWKSIDALQVKLNRKLFLNLDHFEGHYAAYAAGGFYRRHFDSFKRDDARQISFVLYLNKNWVSADGGRLRIHGAEGAFKDIDPVGGTMVCFVSHETDHEVLDSFAARASFTGWFKLAPVNGRSRL